MARVKCEVCGGYVITGKTNYTYENGFHKHKTCPRGKSDTSPEETKARNELTLAIKYTSVKYGKPLNWKLIGTQIQTLRDRGYSYEDQLYALKWVVEKDGAYWGYGRIEKFIDHALEHRRRHMEFVEKLEAQKKKEQQADNDKDAFRKMVQNSSKPDFLW